MPVEVTSASNCSQPSTAASKRKAFLDWLDQLIDEHGPGEYLVRVRADGSVLVKRPRKPLEFEYR